MKISFRLSAASLFILTALLYLSVIKAGFVYDDFWTIVNNPAIRSIQTGSFFSDARTVATVDSGMAQDIYRPLATLSFAIDYRMWGLNAAAFHLTNLLLHLLNGCLFWMVARLLLKKDAPALVATAIFLGHPAQVETVAWVTQRSTLLCALGFLLALWTCLRKGDWTWIRWISLGAGWAVSVFSKETGVMLPAVIWLVDTQGQKLRLGISKLVFYGVGIGLTMVFWMFRWHVVGEQSSVASRLPGLGGQWPLGVIALPVYIGKTIFPWALRVSYDHPVWDPVRLLWSSLVVSAILALFSSLWIRRGIPAIALGWMLLTLAPVLHIIPIVPFLAERFMYIPLMGFSLGMGWLYDMWPRSRALLLLWITGLLVVTAGYVPVWTSERSLWTCAVSREPSNAFAHACLAESLGNSAAAETEYYKAIVNRPPPGVKHAAYQNLAALNHAWGHSWKANYWRKWAEKT